MAINNRLVFAVNAGTLGVLVKVNSESITIRDWWESHLKFRLRFAIKFSFFNDSQLSTNRTWHWEIFDEDCLWLSWFQLVVQSQKMCIWYICSRSTPCLVVYPTVWEFATAASFRNSSVYFKTNPFSTLFTCSVKERWNLCLICSIFCKLTFILPLDSNKPQAKSKI